MRGTMMSRLILGLVAVFALSTAACDDEAKAAPNENSKWPASSAGIACQLLEYDAVKRQLGTAFDAAGGAKRDNTLTCALTQKDKKYPYLTLALTPSTIDSVVFTESVKPPGAYVLPDIGVIAYRATVPATEEVGASLDIVWLSNTSRLVTLRYGFPLSTAPEEIDEFMPRMLALAKQVEESLPE